jgi:hypothetical protein
MIAIGWTIRLLDASYDRRGTANEDFEIKTRRIGEAADERDWMLFVDLHERHRLDAVIRLIEEGIRAEQLWPVVGYVWCDTESVRQNFDLWRDIWSMDDTDQALVMSDQERDALALLPERFEIWRGVGHEDAVRGYSWTLNREKACWYAARYADDERLPLLAAGWIRKGRRSRPLPTEGRSGNCGFSRECSRDQAIPARTTNDLNRRARSGRELPPSRRALRACRNREATAVGASESRIV